MQEKKDRIGGMHPFEIYLRKSNGPRPAFDHLLQGEFQISVISLCAAPIASRLTVIKSEKTEGDGECNAHLGGVDYSYNPEVSSLIERGHQ